MDAIEKISQDIILNILSRLPLKSLMQCKCVSKRWYSLINDPILAELHLHRSKCDSINLVICQYRPSITVWEIQIYKLDNESHPQLSSSLKTNIEDISSVYSCEGLICISGSADIHICNPSTRELVTLPRSNSLKESFMHGFGYSPNTREYKVVQLMHNKLIDGCSRLLSKFEVLTLGTKSWRPIGNVPYVLHPEKKSITLNGIMYWLTYTKKRGFDSQEEIATFNVGDERFGAISGPPDCHAFESMSAISLGVLQGTLCLTCDHFGRRVINHKLEIWMLRDDNVCGWVKQYSIDTSLWKIHRPCNIFPLHHWKGKILLEDLFSGILWYDPGTNTFEENLRYIDCVFPCVCMESLMPLVNRQLLVMRLTNDG
ncbi:F-box protein CPR30 [Acorus calamus]|uniref:F-box protein CPR30 n=1 Tax=Acorus calamus TaxID=4465 RepID=A0AAV9C1D6_ACOCL|nr:F-box protein CPR30 [Acorus calamus]